MFVFNRPVAAIIGALILASVLGGCESTRDWVSGDGKDIAVTNASNTTGTVSLNPPSAGSTPLSDTDLRNMTRKLSGGSVEVYDIGGADAAVEQRISIAPSVPSVASVQTPQGMVYPGNSSVTVYPIDDYNANIYGEAAYPVPMQPAAVSSAPVSSVYGDVEQIDGKAGKPASVAGKDISRIYFAYGSANLDHQDKTVLKETANTAKFAPVDRVRVEGHASVEPGAADPIRARILNLEESMKRAYAVSQNLIKQGVPAEKIKTVAWGDTIPAGTPAAQRRVDVVTGTGY